MARNTFWLFFGVAKSPVVLFKNSSWQIFMIFEWRAESEKCDPLSRETLAGANNNKTPNLGGQRFSWEWGTFMLENDTTLQRKRGARFPVLQQ